MAVDLNALLGLLLGQELSVDEELSDRGPLVALELNDLAGLGVLDDGAVARELLLEGLEDLLGVELCQAGGRGRVSGRQTEGREGEERGWTDA